MPRCSHRGPASWNARKNWSSKALRWILSAPLPHLNYSGLLNRMGRYSDAMVMARKALELTPGMHGAVVNLCEAQLLSEMPNEALDCASDIPLRPHRLEVNALVQHTLGNTVARDEQLQLLIDEVASERAFLIARVYAWSGNNDAAFDWLARAVAEEQNILGLKSDRMFHGLYDDPRWQGLLFELGLTDEQLARYRL